jgi:predicted enzyme related to lactoylglutathione lyase
MATQRVRLTFAALAAALPIGLLPAQSEAGGDIYWFSLLTEDSAAAIAFYQGLFGWEIEPSPTGASMAVRNGTPFAGINQIEDRIPDVSESLWLAAITVDDLEQSVAKARELGATVHEEITHLPGWGSFALIQDPQGAPVSLVVPERELGGNAGFSGWRWAELWTHDIGAAAGFYSSVVGYELERVNIGDQFYDTFVGSGGQRNGSLIALDRAEVAPRWAPYVGVTDLRAILLRVWQNGGQVLREPEEIDIDAAGENRVALIADPTGAAMFLYQLDAQASADPIVAGRAASGPNRTPRPEVSNDGPNVRVNVVVSYGYGFGPGWGAAYPGMPYGRYGPY